MLTSETRDRLVQEALHARHWAYAPYSHYQVGAAVLTSSGKIYDGCNIENASYPVTLCAERVAVVKAVSEGELQIEAIAVVSEAGNPPCGACRQALNEFGPGMQMILVDQNGNITSETTLDVLLPGAFGPKDLLER